MTMHYPPRIELVEAMPLTQENGKSFEVRFQLRNAGKQPVHITSGCAYTAWNFAHFVGAKVAPSYWSGNVDINGMTIDPGRNLVLQFNSERIVWFTKSAQDLRIYLRGSLTYYCDDRSKRTTDFVAALGPGDTYVDHFHATWLKPVCDACVAA